MLQEFAHTLSQIGASTVQSHFGSALDSMIPEGSTGVSAVLGVLTVLALLDSTSFGTLLIPVWFLTAPGRLRVGRVLFYLLVVGGSYALIGIGLLSVLLLFGDGLFGWLEEARGNPVFLMTQLAAGVGLILMSLRIDPMSKAGKDRKRQRDEAKAATGRGPAERIRRFRESAIGERSQGRWLPLMWLALAAVILEIATLLPYLAGIGLVATTDPGIPLAPLMIVFYCLVMLVPALVLLIGRIVAHKVLEQPLQKLEAFMSRHSNGAFGWVLFLLGLLLGLNALGPLQEAGVF